MSADNEDACCLPEWKACCCTCKYHWQDFHHCATPQTIRGPGMGCVCSQPRGWACVAFAFTDGDPGRIHSGWGEHGMCEMHTPK